MVGWPAVMRRTRPNCKPSTLFGTAWLAFGVAGAVGPIAMGRAHDATGSYEVVLVYMAVGTLAIAALILSLPPYDQRARAETVEPS